MRAKATFGLWSAVWMCWSVFYWGREWERITYSSWCVSAKCLLSESCSLLFLGPLKNGCSFEDDLSLGAEGKYSALSPSIGRNCSQVLLCEESDKEFHVVVSRFQGLIKVNEPTDKQEWLLALFYVWVFYNVVYHLSICVLISLSFLFGLCVVLSLHKDTGRHAHTCMWYSG